MDVDGAAEVLEVPGSAGNDLGDQVDRGPGGRFEVGSSRFEVRGSSFNKKGRSGKVGKVRESK